MFHLARSDREWPSHAGAPLGGAGVSGRGSVRLPPFQPHPAAPGLQQPLLMVVVDTEEEFDWNEPFNRDSTATSTVPGQDRAHALYDRLGVVPTYVMDYAVATAPVATRYLRRLVDAGRAEVGTHCHPWVTPPHVEAVTMRNSFHGNLPPDLEAAKIRASTEAVAQAFGRSPRTFKAGRYGLGPKTFDTLIELGYTVDCSFVPHVSFADQEGPDFYGQPEGPFFVDAQHSLLEVPLTVGYTGRLAQFGRRHDAWLDTLAARSLLLPRALRGSGLIERARLTPEGFDAATQCRLLRSMIEQGTRVFTLTYHSPSMTPGHTPYVPDAQALDELLRRIETVLVYFQRELGGAFTTMSKFEQLARAGSVGGAGNGGPAG